MIKKIKKSLLAKVFLLTMCVLLFVSLIIYLVLAWFTPRTYSNTLNEELDTLSRAFVSKIEQVSMKDSGVLFDQFMQSQDVVQLELYREDGTIVGLPTAEQQDTVWEYTYAVEEASGSSEESAPVLSDTYEFQFADSDTVYQLVVYGNASQVLELKKAFVQVLPLLTVVILLVSFIVSWLYSYLIAELKNANLRLEKDIENEKKMERARIDFFSAVSHELKTPITVIKGQLEGMLLEVGAYKDRDKYLERSLQVANTLEQMVQEILTISRLESSGEILTEQVDLTALVNQYLEESEDRIIQKELQINLDMPGMAYVKVNKLLMEKVFSNLIGNAVIYSPRKADIHIQILRDKNEWAVSIENTGTHIDEDEFSKLFSAFYRVDKSRNRQTGGSGLGLYITQKILEQYGSVCNVKNTEAGVRFYFRIGSYQ